MYINVLFYVKNYFCRILRLKPYRCTAGKLTIVIGRNLDDCGISQSEDYVMLINDIMNCEKQLQSKIPDIYNGLDEVRKSVLLNMCFNLGINGLLGFKNTLAFVKVGDWERAANNMLVSKWAKQVVNEILMCTSFGTLKCTTHYLN
ncbi:MAG: lysozyme [Candidatus Cloacimonetes bacterium]|jgi:lysozyme|nr:lysozyme [Candidatus Cloacimonas sp.]MDD2251329.1 lysozyme [Candidatus Cloacimonadota bacterium]